VEGRQRTTYADRALMDQRARDPSTFDYLAFLAVAAVGLDGQAGQTSRTSFQAPQAWVEIGGSSGSRCGVSYPHGIDDKGPSRARKPGTYDHQGYQGGFLHCTGYVGPRHPSGWALPRFQDTGALRP